MKNNNHLLDLEWRIYCFAGGSSTVIAALICSGSCVGEPQREHNEEQRWQMLQRRQQQWQSKNKWTAAMSFTVENGGEMFVVGKRDFLFHVCYLFILVLILKTYKN